MRQLTLALFSGMIAVLGAAEVAFAGCNSQGAVSCSPAAAPPVLPASVLPLTYAQAVTTTVPVYADPFDEALGLPPIRVLESGFVWVSLADPEPVEYVGQAWYHINPEGYVHADQFKTFNPSPFHGTVLSATPDKPLGWVVYGVRVSGAPGDKPTTQSRYLARYTLLTIYEEQKVGDWTWYRVGDNEWVEQRQVGVVKPSARPPEVGSNDKWIEVNLYEQTLAAYEGDRMVYATLVSTGLPQWHTPAGLFRIWVKTADAKMSGADGKPDYYYLEDVPWIMYFNQSVALHGEYWHDRLGAPHSHGCVNLSPTDAKWLFDWTTPSSSSGPWALSSGDNPGTWVWVH